MNTHAEHTFGLMTPMRAAGLRAAWLLAMLLSLSACSMFGDDDEEEIDLEPAELLDFDEEVELRKVWAESIGDGQGGVFNRLQLALDGDTLYAAAADGVVVALDKNSGKTRWRSKTKLNLGGGVGVGDGKVLVGSIDGDVVALDQASGSKLWSVKVTGEVLAAPAAADGMVVAQSFDGKLWGLNGADGERVWSFDSNLPVLTVRGTASPIIQSGIVYAAFASGKLVTFDLADGKLRWDARVAVASGQSEIERVVDVDGQPLIIGGTVYAVSYQGRLTAIDTRTGRPKWFQDASSHNGLTEGFGNIYYTHSDGDVVAIDLSTGGERWRESQFARRELSAPVAFSNYVAVADFEGYIHLLSQVDGHVAGREKLGSDGVRVPMLVSDDLLYAYGNKGKLVAYRLQR